MTTQDGKEAFLSLPGCFALFTQPNTTWQVPDSRLVKDSTEDSFFADTLKTQQTAQSCVILFQKPDIATYQRQQRQASQPSHHGDGTQINTADRSTVIPIPEISLLVRLGHGLNGHRNILHGGMIAALIDEAMGMLQNANQRFTVEASQGHPSLRIASVGSFTVELKVQYKRPVTTPGVVLLVASYVKRDGRKEWMKVEVKQFDPTPSHDGGGHRSEDGDRGEWVVCATGEGFFVEPKAKAHKI